MNEAQISDAPLWRFPQSKEKSVCDRVTSLSYSNPSSPGNLLGSHITFISGLLKGVTVADTLTDKSEAQWGVLLTQQLLENEGLHDATAEALKGAEMKRATVTARVTVARKKAWKQRRQDCSVIGVAQTGIHCASTAGMFHVSPFYLFTKGLICGRSTRHVTLHGSRVVWSLDIKSGSGQVGEGQRSGRPSRWTRLASGQQPYPKMSPRLATAQAGSA